MAILLTGGTGKTGLPLAKLLHAGGHKVLLTSRTPSSIPTPYVGVKFEWFDKSTWEAPFKAANGSVKAIYLVSPPSLEAVETIKSFIEFAQAKGTKRFVLLSASPVERGGFGLGPVHEYLATSKLEYSVLRPTWFTENFTEQPPYVKVITEQDSFATATSKASLPFISTEDIGRVAVRALTAEKSLDTDFVIVGPELLTYDQVAAKLSEVTKRTITHRKLSVEEVKKYRAEEYGMPLPFAELMANMDVAVEAGSEEKWLKEKTIGIAEFETTTPSRDIKVVVGEKTVAKVFSENAGRWNKPVA